MMGIALPNLGLSKSFNKLNPSFMPMGDYVIIIHGLLRTKFSMRKYANILEDMGLKVLMFGYNSRSNNINYFADVELVKFIHHNCIDKAKKIHFVTFSMGGIVARVHLHNHPKINIGKVVMIAPPNHGSNWANILSRFYLARLIWGPSLTDLKEGEGTFISTLPNNVNYECGVIAGDKPLLGFLFDFILEKPHDSKVTVKSTKLENIKDHIVLPHGHFGLLNAADTIFQTIYFLNHGYFYK